MISQLNNDQFPINFQFSFWLGYEIKLTDKNSNVIGFIKQKMLKLKEHIEIFSDETKSTKLYDIRTNQILDWGANYQITNSDGALLGSVRRKGWKSLWKSTYLIYSADNHHLYTIKEENPWIKLFDGMFSEIPIVGIFSGYFFNPAYTLHDTQNNLKYKLKKIPQFFSREFRLVDRTPAEEDHPELCILSFFMVLILERNRG